MKTGKLLDKETAGVNQILPHKHKRAWELYEQAIKNNWVPTEVPMVKDVDTMASLLVSLGSKVTINRKKNRIEIKNNRICRCFYKK